jgi:hypothetical protein
VILAAALVVGLPQSSIVTLCNQVHYRQEYLHERDTWERAWVYLNWVGVDLRPQDKREVMAFCAQSHEPDLPEAQGGSDASVGDPR